MNGVISVIIPVYNVAAYLPQCMDSLLAQDYEKLEVILVNDGSRDDSGAICDAYGAKDNRVKVIHQPNGGAAAAKNAGLRVATGEYLTFLDSDDYLEPNVYGYMIKLLQEENADAVQCAFRDVWKGRSQDCIVYPGRETVDSDEYLRRLTVDFSCALLWNKLYRRELYEGIFFEEGHKIDDEYFTYQGFLKDRKIIFDDRVIYNYRRRASGAMGSPAAAYQRLQDKLDSMEKRRKMVLKYRPQLRKVYDHSYLDSLWCLSGLEGNTEETILQFRNCLKNYLLTPGNSLPPRYLWCLLWRLLTWDTKRLLERCQKAEQQIDLTDFFA